MWAVLLAACGKVAEVSQDARPADALLDAFTCAGSALQCGDTCVEPTADDLNCGACGVACGSGTACLAGECTDATSSCAVIHALDPSAPSGAFTDTTQNHFFYCDMAHGPMQYEALGFGEWDVAVTGWTLATVADLQDPDIQGAFLALFNHQGGAQLVATFTSSDCCIRSDATNVLQLSTVVLEPAIAGGAAQCNGSYASALWTFTINGAVQALPLPSTFFSANPVTGADVCGPAEANPGFFWKRHM